jgi:hypothetical protein
MIGARFTMNGRALTVTGSYDGHGADDPPGWYYRFDDEPDVAHWISARAVPIRFDEGTGVMDAKFKIGDRVEKHTGAYTSFGEVRCAYTTKRGDIRYVVEVEPQGFQMIWSAKELRLVGGERASTGPERAEATSLI